MRCLRGLSDLGQAILCTIHQPSSVLLEYFDDLLLLETGGKTVYHGPLGERNEMLLHSFENYGAQPCPQEANPAEYMLEGLW